MIRFSYCVLLVVALGSNVSAFVPQTRTTTRHTPLFVSIGLGPEEQKQGDEKPVAGVDYEVPNHEEYRLSRRSQLDEQCDAWFGKLLGEGSGMLGPLAEEARERLLTPVELKNEVEKDRSDEEWTPYVSTKLPWMPLLPAYGLEQYGIPVPRRNAEPWRHFDVPGLIAHDYSGRAGQDELTETNEMRTKLQQQGAWLDDDKCDARLIYVNGNFVPQLSKTSDTASNLASLEDASDQVRLHLSRLTDGFTDELAAPVPVENGKPLTRCSKLSGPNHAVGDATSQFAINTQQGTACFAALNTIHTNSVAMVHTETVVPKPVLIVNAITPSGGNTNAPGVTVHPRTLVLAEEGSVVSVIQQSVDLDTDSTNYKPKLYNGYSQFFVKANANVTHSYLEETGGIVTPSVELNDEAVPAGAPKPREVEAQRPELSDSHLEAIDVHLMGANADYQGTLMCMGGSGRVRVGHSVTLLQPGAHATVNGFGLSGGAQRCDMKTNLHHVAQGTTSRQIQKNMIGGRSTGSFRGRVRVEQSAQQTDSEQLSRTILLSDKARAWAVPSLEIIADDVKCTHGATVSDLSEEELFYLRSRGLNRALSRNLLMYAFAGDVSNCVDPAMLGSVDSKSGLQQRVIQRLENLVPQGERAVKAEFQSI